LLDQKDYHYAARNYREAVRRRDASSKDSLNAVIPHSKLRLALYSAEQQGPFANW